MKRVLILTAAYGEGHNAAARGLEAGLRLAGGDQVTVRVADLYHDILGEANNVFRSGYLLAINRAPRLWQAFYRWLDQNKGAQDLGGRNPLLVRAAQDWIRGFRPDVVATTFPVYNMVLRHVTADPPFRVVSVVTDAISVHSIWHRAPVDDYAVINEDTAAVLQAAGIPPRQVHVTGFPVSPYFATHDLPPLDPPAPGRTRILYIINATRFDAVGAVRSLLELPGVDLTVTCGRFEQHRAALNALAERHPGRLTVLGWTREMPRLLLTHHLVISKAGGATTAEAVAARCPMIVTQVVPGQEEGNLETLVRAGAGAYCGDVPSLHRCVAGLLDDDAAGWRRWKDAITRISRPDASRRLAGLVLDGVLLPG